MSIFHNRYRLLIALVKGTQILIKVKGNRTHCRTRVLHSFLVYKSYFCATHSTCDNKDNTDDEPCWFQRVRNAVNTECSSHTTDTVHHPRLLKSTTENSKNRFVRQIFKLFCSFAKDCEQNDSEQRLVVS